MTSPVPGKPKNEKGADFNLFKRVTITSSSFADYADVTMNFRHSNLGFTMLFEGSGTIEYSFNGITVHGDMDSAKATKGLVFDNRKVDAIWFRLGTASSGVTVRVEAWAV